MTSKAKIESNRRNAKKSTGPRTPQGKLVSSRNALRHGLLSTQALLPDEDLELFATLTREMIAKVEPRDALDECRMQDAIMSVWRRLRVQRMESATIAYRTSEAAAKVRETGRTTDSLAIGLITDARAADTLSKFGRYERARERTFYRALCELRERRGNGKRPVSEVTSGDPRRKMRQEVS
jgi:hypothetical protein